jgi:hypothetical protein
LPVLLVLLTLQLRRCWKSCSRKSAATAAAAAAAVPVESDKNLVEFKKYGAARRAWSRVWALRPGGKKASLRQAALAEAFAEAKKTRAEAIIAAQNKREGDKKEEEEVELSSTNKDDDILVHE